MTTDMRTTVLLVVIIAGIVVLSGLFFLLAVYGLVLTDKSWRSKFGTALGHTVGPLGLFLLALIPFFVNRLLNGPGQPLPNQAADTGVRLLLAVSIIWALVGASIAFPGLIQRIRQDPYEVSLDGVFGTLAKAMPIIVANHRGIIQHTTPAFDELARCGPGELVGKDLKVIMPHRYRGVHDAGIQHYVQTREARIVGTVVTVEMLRQDGTEVPVYLALNTTDVDGVPWFVAALWEKTPLTPEAVIAAKDSRDRRQDQRQEEQDFRSEMQDDRGEFQDIRGWEQSKENLRMDTQRHDLEQREDDLT